MDKETVEKYLGQGLAAFRVPPQITSQVRKAMYDLLEEAGVSVSEKKPEAPKEAPKPEPQPKAQEATPKTEGTPNTAAEMGAKLKATLKKAKGKGRK